MPIHLSQSSKSANSTKCSDYRSQYVVWNVGYQCLCGYSLRTAQYAFDMASRQTDLSYVPLTSVRIKSDRAWEGFDADKGAIQVVILNGLELGMLGQEL